MSSVFNYAPIDFDRYLQQERDVEYRSEYVDGKVYAMAGASKTHNTIAVALTATIETQLREGCRVWQSDMKVVIEDAGKRFAYYPDLVVACEEDPDDDYMCTKPRLIIEVLSPSTERIDFGEKLEKYTGIPSLMEYALVSQHVPLARVLKRRGAWQEEMYKAEEVFQLESVGIEVAVSQIYRRVQKEVGLA